MCIIGAALIAPTLSFAQPPGARDLNWPCQQIKVSELSLASVWSGPPVDPRDSSWKDNPAVADLVATVAPRREPIDQAQTLLHDFAQHAGDKSRLSCCQVLVGLFDVLDQERGAVMSGLDRFGKRQKELAAELRADNEKLRTLQGEPSPDPTRWKDDAASEWAVEVFQDRRRALSYACDVPGKIEQRLFALARHIQKQVE